MNTAASAGRMVGPAERGRLVIADRVVRRIAARAAADALAPGDVTDLSVKVATDNGRATLAVALSLPYRAGLQESGERLCRDTAERTAMLTGLTVSRVRIRVRGLVAYPEPGPDALTTPALAALQHTTDWEAKRLWSERRLPSVLTALVSTAICAAALYETVCVRLVGCAHTSLWSRPLTWLSAHRSGDCALALGSLAALLGLGLLALAVLPGRRRSLTLRTPDRGMRAILSRATAESLVRDAVSDVSGVSQVRVRIRRRRARIRATLQFGNRDAVRETVTTAIHRALADCALGRALRVRVHLRPAPGWATERQDLAPHGDTTGDESP
ncbi:DUF6286 domain-containing protein [Streptomyces sp. L2]|uniref:DUF6286 domain-containing protein n=1 Tax=Streptomyces sp. L2 TaxID=2162665 RepID=UPI0010132CA4|nr:DUF6286 domain-containing protein [Streptomyces sp. L2]